MRAGREGDVWLYMYVLYDSYLLGGGKEEKRRGEGFEYDVGAIFKKITGSRFSSIVELKKPPLVHKYCQK